LQALKAVRKPLDVFVVDKSDNSLKVSRERYDIMPAGKIKHNVNYLKEIPKGNFDIIFITTRADIRAEMIRKALQSGKVKYMVLEKWLFTNLKDYAQINGLLNKHRVKAWVNCSMRMMPFYKSLLLKFKGKRISYSVTGSNFGLVTNLIHYIDHAVSMAGSDEFELLTGGLDKKIIPSKRNGFLELTGTAIAKFKDGSICSVTSWPQGSAPIIVQMQNDSARCIYKESEGKAWLAEPLNNWKWREYDAPVPFQSQLTTLLTESILNNGKCDLVSYNQSMKIHIQLVKPLLNFVNQNSRVKYKNFPFT
jgi:predicted dehydrogenase